MWFYYWQLFTEVPTAIFRGIATLEGAIAWILFVGLLINKRFASRFEFFGGKGINPRWAWVPILVLAAHHVLEANYTVIEKAREEVNALKLESASMSFLSVNTTTREESGRTAFKSTLSIKNTGSREAHDVIVHKAFMVEGKPDFFGKFDDSAWANRIKMEESYNLHFPEMAFDGGMSGEHLLLYLGIEYYSNSEHRTDQWWFRYTVGSDATGLADKKHCLEFEPRVYEAFPSMRPDTATGERTSDH